MTERIAFKPVLLLCFPLLMTACHKAPVAGLSNTPHAGQAFAQSSCGRCHGVGRFGTSPNPNAPPFPVIVNKEGLTADTLSTWLQGAHNYPKEMDFYLREPEVDALVTYMLTLKEPNYRRPPD